MTPRNKPRAHPPEPDPARPGPARGRRHRLRVIVGTRTETITTDDGGTMSGYVAVPPSASGPGVLVLMEIFGVGPYIRRAAERIAELGYVALAPDLYRRIAPDAAFAHDPEGMAAGMQTARKLDRAGAVQDAITALAALRALPECTGGTAVLGFCLGGALAFGVAVNTDPAAAVCYYGSSIGASLGDADRISCPVLFHYGADDPYIPKEEVDAVAAAAAARPDWEHHVQPAAGHAFDNHESEMFFAPEAAAQAWEITRAFLARALPASV